MQLVRPVDWCNGCERCSHELAKCQLNANNSITSGVDSGCGSKPPQRPTNTTAPQDLDPNSPLRNIMNRTARLITSVTFAATALVGISAPAFASPKSDAVNAARVENRARSQATYDANKVRRDTRYTENSARRDATYAANSARRDATFQSCLTGAAAATTKEAREAAKAACKASRGTTKTANEAARETTRTQNKVTNEATRAANKAAWEQTKAANKAAIAAARASVTTVPVTVPVAIVVPVAAA